MGSYSMFAWALATGVGVLTWSVSPCEHRQLAYANAKSFYRLTRPPRGESSHTARPNFETNMYTHDKTHNYTQGSFLNLSDQSSHAKGPYTLTPLNPTATIE